MAGNNSIQILRGTSDAISKSTDTLLDGQLLYDTTKNVLYCGGGSVNKTSGTSKPIKRMRPIYTDWSNVTGRPLELDYWWVEIMSFKNWRMTDSPVGSLSFNVYQYQKEDTTYRNSGFYSADTLFKLRILHQVSPSDSNPIITSLLFTLDPNTSGRQIYEMIHPQGGIGRLTVSVTENGLSSPENPYFSVQITSNPTDLITCMVYAMRVQPEELGENAYPS